MEMLVAVGLLAVIIIGLLAMFNQTQKTLHRGVTQVDVLETGRAVMQLLTRELQGMSAPPPASTNPPLPAVFYAVEPRNPASLLQLPVPGASTNIVCELQGIAFHSRIGDEWTTEYLGFTASNRNDALGTLYRSVSSGSITNVPDLSSVTWDNFATPPPADFRRVADGILHLKLLAYTPDGLVIAANKLPYLPAHVDVELGVLEPKSVERLRSMPVAARATYLKNHPAEVHFFRQRVPIRAYNPETYP